MISRPISRCCAPIAATSSERWVWSPMATPRSSDKNGRLPTWVVRIFVTLRCIALARLFRGQHRTLASGAHQAAGHGASMLAALEDRRAGDHCRFIALDALHEA